MRNPKKRCAYCGRWFQPDPRIGDDQKACPRKTCRRQRKRQAQARWRADHPDYFRGSTHYHIHKEWLAKPGNADYLRRYRTSHPAYVAADNRRRTARRRLQKAREKLLRVSDMKDAIHRWEINRIRSLSASDMKDTIRLRLDGLFDHLSSCPWSPRADMKDEIAPAAAPA
jgi:hypothetical protein